MVEWTNIEKRERLRHKEIKPILKKKNLNLKSLLKNKTYKTRVLFFILLKKAPWITFALLAFPSFVSMFVEMVNKIGAWKCQFYPRASIKQVAVEAYKSRNRLHPEIALSRLMPILP